PPRPAVRRLKTMRPLLLFSLTCLLSGALAVGGSILGNALGPTGLLGGALAGGVLGVVGAAVVGRRAGWFAPAAFGATVAGGLAGFAVAFAVAASNLHTPAIPVLSEVLVGAGSVLGSRRGVRVS
ncbi:MAG TPA: hypothetical protein VD997_02145, partial [Phycisphaerales bacterium]|nr:hypothetical protein [Phycisphaerales bacterium]